MEHSVRDDAGAIVVELAGDVDLERSPSARTILLECVGKGKSVYVDMAGVTYIDSSGVASLVESFQSARAGGTGFTLISVSEEVMRVIQLARLDKIFTIHDSLDTARQAGD
jgi:anti-sigma B factor antagonist